MYILYSTNCPKCNVLEKRFKQNGIDFSISYDIDKLIDAGFQEAPMVYEVEKNKWYNFEEAIKINTPNDNASYNECESCKL